MENFNGLYNTDSFSDRFSSKAKDRLRRTFKRDTSYREVVKYNSDGTTVVDFPIQISNSSNKQNRYKNFIAHPDYSVDYGDTFDIGDAIVIVTEINENNKISDDGLMWQCNETLKWKYDGEIFSQKCYIDNKSYSTDDDKNILVVNSKIELYTQMTDNLENIDINQDFIFGNYFKRVYKLISIDDSTKDGLAVMTMELTQSNANDDLDDNIADNPQSDSDVLRVDSSLDDTYYLLSPKSSEIRLYDVVSYDIRHYDVSDTLLSTTFTFNIIGIDSDSYNLTDITGNGLTLESVTEGGSGTLEITNTDTSEIISVNIELGGLF